MSQVGQDESEAVVVGESIGEFLLGGACKRRSTDQDGQPVPARTVHRRGPRAGELRYGSAENWQIACLSTQQYLRLLGTADQDERWGSRPIWYKYEQEDVTRTMVGLTAGADGGDEDQNDKAEGGRKVEHMATAMVDSPAAMYVALAFECNEEDVASKVSGGTVLMLLAFAVRVCIAVEVAAEVAIVAPRTSVRRLIVVRAALPSTHERAQKMILLIVLWTCQVAVYELKIGAKDDELKGKTSFPVNGNDAASVVRIAYTNHEHFIENEDDFGANWQVTWSSLAFSGKAEAKATNGPSFLVCGGEGYVLLYDLISLWNTKDDNKRLKLSAMYRFDERVGPGQNGKIQFDDDGDDEDVWDCNVSTKHYQR
jgi:hypothetical protein